jgi:hypothetical protein
VARLSPAEIGTHARRAGWSGRDLAIAIAVALAESGGRTDAHNPRGLDDSYGLWQINMRGGLGPERRQRYGLKTDTDLYDPATNARVAHAIQSAQGWRPWSTYTSKAYLLWWGVASAAAAAATAGGVVDRAQDAAGEAVDAATALPRAILDAARLPTRTLRWLSDPGTVTRILKVCGGLALIGIGVTGLIGKPVYQVAKDLL